LQRQQADLTKTYSERTAEFLARDLADWDNCYCGCTYGMGPWFRNAASEQEFLDAYAEDAALSAVPGNGLTA
jgi:hypothetical protein